MHLRVDPGAALPEPTLDEMWALRARVLPLKASTAQETEGEVARFRAVVRRATHVARLLDDAGALVAMGAIRRATHAAPQLGAVVELEAAYLAASHGIRGRPGMLWAAWSTLARIAWAPERGDVRPRSALLTGVAYPGSAMLLGALGRVTLWGDAASSAEAALLERVRAAHAEQWDPVRACVSMRTLPLPPTSAWRARAAENPLYRRFVARCPDWIEGYGLPIAVRLDPLRATWGLVREGARRWWSRGARHRPPVAATPRS
jgi:hypothetical protein